MDSRKIAGDDQAMAQKDRAGFSLDSAFLTGSKTKGYEDGTSQEVGNKQPIDLNTPGNK